MARSKSRRDSKPRGARGAGERVGLLASAGPAVVSVRGGDDSSDGDESNYDDDGVGKVFLVSASDSSAGANADSAATCRALRFARNFLCWLVVLLVATVAAAHLYEINAFGSVSGAGRGGRGKSRNRGGVGGSGSGSGGAGDAYYPVALNRHDVLRQYRLFRLPNGLDVACISDPQAHNAAASMNVRAGSFQDPSDALGLAHFTEVSE
jgi:hypothetical protein